MLVDAAAHASDASKRLISPSYLCFGGKAGKIRNTGRVDKTNANGKKETKHRQQYSTGKISLSGERDFSSHKSSPVELFAFVG